MLFPDLNLAEGRNFVTGSKPKAPTFSSDILMVLPNKESFYFISNKFLIYLTLTIQGTKTLRLENYSFNTLFYEGHIQNI